MFQTTNQTLINRDDHSKSCNPTSLAGKSFLNGRFVAEEILELLRIFQQAMFDDTRWYIAGTNQPYLPKNRSVKSHIGSFWTINCDLSFP